MYSNLAWFCGWAYAIIWGISFYPVIYLNMKIKSSDSISVDYIVLNLLGYFCYTLSISLQIFNLNLREQFKLKFHNSLPLLSMVDIFYSVHGLVLNALTLSQILYGNILWGFNNQRKHLKMNKLTKTFYSCFILFLVYNFLYRNREFQLLSFALNLSYFKILVSFTKYLPQVMYNMKRKSMFGISKLQISMDLSGCVFATCELLLKNKQSLRGLIEANTSKIGIITVTLLFDLIYLYQFYLYSNTNQDVVTVVKVKTVGVEDEKTDDLV